MNVLERAGKQASDLTLDASGLPNTFLMAFGLHYEIPLLLAYEGCLFVWHMSWLYRIYLHGT